MIRNFLYDEDAASAVEYAALIALILVVIIGSAIVLGNQSMSTFTNVGNSIGSASS